MTVAKNLQREAQAFLDALAVGESGPGGDYTILYGGSHFDASTPSLPDHFRFPDWAGKDNSHAAGRYQFEPATWLDVCQHLFPAGTTPDFRNPADQDWGAWLLAKSVCNRAGIDLLGALQAGGAGGLVAVLRPTWTSLDDAFPQRYRDALAALPAPAPVQRPPPAPAPSPAPPPSPAPAPAVGPPEPMLTMGLAFATKVLQGIADGQYSDPKSAASIALTAIEDFVR